MNEFISHVKMRLLDYPGYEKTPEAIYALRLWSNDFGSWEPEKAARALISIIQARKLGIWGTWSVDAFESLGVSTKAGQ